jgi:site-specific DNA recombinase
MTDKRAVLYARVSTDDQRDNYSIPTQIDDCLRLVKKRNYSLVGGQYVNSINGQDCTAGNGAIPAYVDDYTSRELSRPSLDAALTYAETTGFDVLIVHALDRLARDPYIRRTLELEFEKHGAAVEYVIGNYDQTPEGEVRKDLDATFAKWENAKRVERSLRGKRGKAERGLFVAGRAPFGYVIDKAALGGLGVNEPEAEIVRYIFHLYVNEELSIRGIARRLTDEKRVTYSGRTTWAQSTVRNILKSTTYIGNCFYNKFKRLKNGRSLAKRDKAHWIKIKVTPIVDKALFDAAQAKLHKSKTEARRKPKRFYLLGGMVYCEKCGRPYNSQTTKAGRKRLAVDAQFYRHRTQAGHCKNRQVSARRLEPVVWAEIAKLLLDPETLKDGYRRSLDQQKVAQTRHMAHLETLGQKRVKFERQRDNLTAAYIDPDIPMTKAEYLAQREPIDRELKAIERDILEIEAELTDVPTPEGLETLAAFSTAVRDVLGDDDALTPKEKRRILKLLNVKVKLGQGDRVEITGWLDSKSTRLTDTTSGRYGRRPPPPPYPALHAPAP